MCLGCGQAMPARPRRGLAVCSERCAKRERRARHRRERWRFCSHCEAYFCPGRADARYCGNPCRQRAYRVRLRARREARQAAINFAASLIG